MRGFGISAGPDLGFAAGVARQVEAFGYRSVWANDTPGGDGLANAAAMLEATTFLRAGVGALPCDRWSAEEIAGRLESFEAPLDRLTLVVGAGRAERPLDVVEQAVLGLRDRLGADVMIGVAALGPKMCRLGGRIADLVLLNWATPGRIAWSRARVIEGTAQRNLPGTGAMRPEIAAYVRLALGPGARDRLSGEASRYAGAPHYARHFKAMGVAPGVAASEPEDAAAFLRPFDEKLDETIVRAVPAAREMGEIIALARAGAPATAD